MRGIREAGSPPISHRRSRNHPLIWVGLALLLMIGAGIIGWYYGVHHPEHVPLTGVCKQLIMQGQWFAGHTHKIPYWEYVNLLKLEGCE
jgi:hypothetical protein